MSRYLRLSLSLVMLMSLLAWPEPAASITPTAPQTLYTVTGFTDSTAACSGVSCPSLRSAILQANAHGGDDDISLPPGTYTLTLAGAGEDVSATGDLDVTANENLTIHGSGATVTIIDGGNLDRVLEVLSGTLTIEDVTLRNASGTGIYNHSSGALTLNHVLLINNNGIGLLNNASTTTIIDSAIAANSAGGVSNLGASATLNINNSTISGNLNGGGISSSGVLVNLRNVTVVSNTITSGGGGINVTGGALLIQNSILAWNTATVGSPDCAGTLTSLGNNIVRDATGCNLGSIPSDQKGTGANPVDPKIGLLQDNGGQTLSHQLLSSSPAINAGNGCNNHSGNPLITDQRGAFRPQSSACDIGAYEAPAVQFSSATYSAAENVGNAAITIELDGNIGAVLTVTVPYTASAGTATAISDFTPATGTVTITPGSRTANLLVPVINDGMDEPDETVIVALGPPANALLDSPSTATLTIVDDDTQPGVAFSSATYTAAEPSGLALITATLSAASGRPITVTYATSNGTAIAGSDYTAVTNQLTFAPNITRATFTVPILNDTTYEPNESLSLTLSNPQNASLSAPNPATLTLLSEDPPRLYLPLIMRDYFVCYTSASESEPNDSAAQANGLLCVGQSISGNYSTSPNLDNDYFALSVLNPNPFTVTLSASGNTTGMQLQLYYQTVSGGSIVGYDGDAPFQVHCPNNSPYPNTCAGATGTYYIRVLMPAGYAGSGYTLSVTSP